MDPTERAIRRARRLRDRGQTLDDRTRELLERTERLVEEIDEHTGKRARSRPQKPTDPYPGRPRGDG